MCRTAGPTLAGSLDSLAKLGQLSLFYRYYSVWYSFRFAELFNELIEYRSLFLREVYSLFWKKFSVTIPRCFKNVDNISFFFFCNSLLAKFAFDLYLKRFKSKVNSYISFWALLNHFSFMFFFVLCLFFLLAPSLVVVD